MIEMQEKEYDKKVSAIVMFGPATQTSGFRPAEYYQVTLDPAFVSPNGEYIRFEIPLQGGEMHGWQRIGAMTVCEVLSDAPDYDAEKAKPYNLTEGKPFYMRTIL